MDSGVIKRKGEKQMNYDEIYRELVSFLDRKSLGWQDARDAESACRDYANARNDRDRLLALRTLAEIAKGYPDCPVKVKTL